MNYVFKIFLSILFSCPNIKTIHVYFVVSFMSGL